MEELVYFSLPSIYFLRLQEGPCHIIISQTPKLSAIRCCSIQNMLVEIYDHRQVSQVETILLRLLLIVLKYIRLCLGSDIVLFHYLYHS